MEISAQMFNFFKLLKQLAKQRPLLAGVLLTTGVWFTFMEIWPDYPLSLNEFIALFVLFTLFSYGCAWTMRKLRKLFSRGGDKWLGQ